ncbi:hypothetical protein ERUR111494_08745 [Erysipelothrix urinaevulpis]|uniref:hypothetical protein n=1 Tax=Erysipelothrix urinaevulpis TaxID=2683717 RepID=UPI0013584E43|nr:hypothetical protein [Erysipelothrix urinaevulpis]
MKKTQLLTILFGFYPLTLVRLPMSRMKIRSQLVLVFSLALIVLSGLFYINALNLITGVLTLAFIFVPYIIGFHIVDEHLI